MTTRRATAWGGLLVAIVASLALFVGPASATLPGGGGGGGEILNSHCVWTGGETNTTYTLYTGCYAGGANLVQWEIDAPNYTGWPCYVAGYNGSISVAGNIKVLLGQQCATGTWESWKNTSSNWTSQQLAASFNITMDPSGDIAPGPPGTLIPPKPDPTWNVFYYHP